MRVMTSGPRCPGERDDALAAVTPAQLGEWTAQLARRTGLDRAVRGKDAADFVQDAIRKILAGERRLRSDVSLRQNVLSIGASLVANERKKCAEEPSTRVEALAVARERLSPDEIFDLDRALECAVACLRTDEVDAGAFARCLRRQIERRASIAPVVIARHLGWSSGRARRAWRRLRTIMRRQARTGD